MPHRTGPWSDRIPIFPIIDGVDRAHLESSCPPAGHDEVRQKFAAALDALVEQVKADRSVLAALLCGSLSHDTVWAKSDIDLVLVTIDDRKVEHGDLCALRRRRERPRDPDTRAPSSARWSRDPCATRSRTRS